MPVDTFGNFSGTEILDTESFAPPTYGGAVAKKYATLAYTDTSAKNLFSLPKGALIVGWDFIIGTAFNAVTTNTIKIGDATTLTRFANAVAAGVAGIFDQTKTGFVSAQLFAALTDDVQVTATYVETGDGQSAGAAVIAVEYILI
jgi:hypothetical protein